MASVFEDPNLFLEKLPSVEDIKQRINDRFKDLYNPGINDELRPYVCCVCDEFILRKSDIAIVSVKKMKKAKSLLSWSENLRESERIQAIEASYRFPEPVTGMDEENWLDGMALSPRGSLKSLSMRQAPGFVTCHECKECVEKGKMPLYAIVNRNYVGCPPEVLRDLNDVELSFLTPIRSYGYFFTFEGGKMKQMKGHLTFMRVSERQITKSVTTLEHMGLTKHVVILTSGPMTQAQQDKVKKLTTVRTEKMIAAVKWLCKNHSTWKKVDVQKIITQLGHTKPIWVEKSSTVESGNATVEDEVVFTCYYPDGATNSRTGGFQNADDFKKFVDETKQHGFDAHLHANVEKEFVKCSDGDHLIGACLLQFPYGLGSMDETRVLPNKKVVSRSNLGDFLDHLGRKSDPLFHQSLFQLILYSMMSKARILRSSGFQLKQKINAEALADGFDSKDFSRACRARRDKKSRKRKGSKVSNILLDAVDATAKDLPHTDKAARSARSTMESMFHLLGMGSVFLTVTFDDQNSLLMQVLSGITIDKGERIEDLSEEELLKRAKSREMLRFEFPGIAAVNFEMMLNILLEEVIGWDMDNNEPIQDFIGLFGKLLGLAFAIEEQGRKTLHVHFILWVEKYKELQQSMFFGDDHFQKPEARTVVTKYFDHLATTDLFPNNDHSLLRKAFDHSGCSVPRIRDRELPEVLCDAELRILRHKKGYEHLEGEFASCPHCSKTWSYEELVTDLIKQGYDIRDKVTPTPPDSTSDSEKTVKHIQKERLHAMCVQYQHPNKEMEGELATCINAAYQSHSSCHHKNCFRCSKLRGSEKRKHVCGTKCECRYRLPDRKRRRTMVHTAVAKATWFSWTGEEKQQPLIQFFPKRGRYDLFQNVSCKAISESKFSCNSNVNVITDGPVGMYSCKYINKDNQHDDTAEYAEVEASLKKMDTEGRRHEDEKAEALRIMCRAAFAHNKANVIGAAMASYFVRNDSRFYFSHKFAFCPLKDVMRLHNKQDVIGTVNIGPTGDSFFENQALHYLCRPENLENVSLKRVTEKYVVGYVTKKTTECENPVIPFLVDTGYFQHPSAKMSGRGKNKELKCSQGFRERDVDTYIKVPQWAFPDSEQFRNSILTCSDSDINRAMETYSQLVLTLLVPHRHCGELKCPNSATFPYCHKFRNIYYEDQDRKQKGLEPKIFTDSNLEFLQNIQNAAYNSLRYKLCSDDLADDTEPFEYQDPDGQSPTHQESDDEDEAQTDGYEDILSSLQDEYSRPTHDDDPTFLLPTLNNFSFKHIRNSGDDRCGWSEDIDLPDLVVPESNFVKTTPSLSREKKKKKKRQPQERKTYTVKEVTKVLLHKRTKTLRNVWEGKSINVGEATGTVKSIREWSKEGFGKDRKQQRAFEAIIAAFLLTFHEDSNPDEYSEQSETTKEEKIRFRRNRYALLKLKGQGSDTQLIALLHGPGGSGKSTVINLTVAYARSFCDVLGHEFTSRTIVLTAMSGVAATLLHGETAHMALGMNKKKPLPNWMKEDYTDTRLVIIDEISFASVEAIEKIHECLIELSKTPFRKYGAMNIVFAGDYSQLDPVRAKHKVWQRSDMPEFHKALNCFIELCGKHRFLKDPEWGERLLRFRGGIPTFEDIDVINEHCHISNRIPPKHIQVATYYNKNRDAINSAIFEDWCEANRPQDGSVQKNACIILMDNLEMTKSSGSYVEVTSNEVKHFFYENCSENDCKIGDSQRGRVDPVLKLYPNCPMMLTQNQDVPSGQANGSRVRVKEVRAKPGEESSPLKLDCGTVIQVFLASQVECIVVEQEREDIVPRVFEVRTENWTFETELEIGSTNLKVRMKGSQIPLISNSCTTGHKLQGCTVDDILVNDWVYDQNWAYVVLSRVRTMDGLYIRQKLSRNLAKYKKNDKIKEMLDTFRDEIALEGLTDQEYESMIQNEENGKELTDDEADEDEEMSDSDP